MTPYHANPFAYIFSVLAIAAVALYFLYAAYDRWGLEVSSTFATVTGKQHTQSRKTYRTTIIDGRSMVQSDEIPEVYAVVLMVGNEATSGMVSKELYDSLQTEDNVQVKVRRTRMTRRLEVIEVKR